MHSAFYGQTYHSLHGALQESRHVYTNSSGFAARCSRGDTTTVLEIGFGLGLNFLLSASLATRHRTPLTYHAIEHRPITADRFDELNYTDVGIAPDLVAQCRTVFAAWPETSPSHRQVNAVVDLTIDPSDFALWQPAGLTCDIVFLDAFSPEVNPECWQADRLRVLYDTLVDGGVLVSFCVKGVVRRRLEAVGFVVERLPGPPGKREILRAIR